MFAIYAILAGILGLAMLAEYPFSAWADENYQAYYLFLGNDPDELETDWAAEAQGLTHDDTHWYITQTEDIWRVPVRVDLNSLSTSTPDVQRRQLDSVPQLVEEEYNHFGDPSHFRFQGRGYLIVPIHTPRGFRIRGGVAIFRADETLTYIDHVTIDLDQHPIIDIIDDIIDLGQLTNDNVTDINDMQGRAPWFGVDQLGRIYSSSDNDVSQIFRYTVDWPTLAQAEQLSIQFDMSIGLRAENGGTLMLDGVQGGVFTDDGQRLYMVADGIHVFDTSNWRHVQASQNGMGHFNYAFDKSFNINEEPEGITIWDLESTASPHRGELHVMLLDNDDEDLEFFDPIDDDDIYIKHYTGTIHVDAANTGEQVGTPEQPFRTIKAAADLAWHGAEISIRAGLYPENITILKAVRMVARGSTVRIGE